MRYSPLPLITKTILSIFLLLAFFAPLPYVIVLPGSAKNIFDSVIRIKGEKIYPANGRMDLLTIRVTSPDSKVFGPEVLYSWINGQSAVYPVSAIYKPGRTSKEEKAIAKAGMNQSQERAVISALNYLRQHPEITEGREVKRSNISFNVKAIGGPSGGMAFSIALIELLGNEDLLRGRHVAGTGTISSDGKVGAIGGIAEKITAAKRAGASLFIAPRSNCAEIKIVPIGMKLVAVATLSQAVAALRAPIEVSSSRTTFNGCDTVGT